MEKFHENQSANLGASDLAYLTRQDAPDRDQIDQIAAMIRGFGGKPSQTHLAAFGELLSGSIDEVPATLRPAYIREGMRIVDRRSDVLERAHRCDDLREACYRRGRDGMAHRPCGSR